MMNILIPFCIQDDIKAARRQRRRLTVCKLRSRRRSQRRCRLNANWNEKVFLLATIQPYTPRKQFKIHIVGGVVSVNISVYPTYHGGMVMVALCVGVMDLKSLKCVPVVLLRSFCCAVVVR
jgi:hypothetical protein